MTSQNGIAESVTRDDVRVEIGVGRVAREPGNVRGVSEAYEFDEGGVGSDGRVHELVLVAVVVNELDDDVVLEASTSNVFDWSVVDAETGDVSFLASSGMAMAPHRVRVRGGHAFVLSKRLLSSVAARGMWEERAFFSDDMLLVTDPFEWAERREERSSPYELSQTEQEAGFVSTEFEPCVSVDLDGELVAELCVGVRGIGNVCNSVSFVPCELDGVTDVDDIVDALVDVPLDDGAALNMKSGREDWATE